MRETFSHLESFSISNIETEVTNQTENTAIIKAQCRITITPKKDVSEEYPQSYLGPKRVVLESDLVKQNGEWLIIKMPVQSK